ncbi:MauE/DoxX family redox-associated membrane protein [Chloroflexota bacterium]
MKRWFNSRLRMNLHPVVVGAAILVGLTLLVAGTGKLPGQSEFADALLKSFWTPSTAYFIVYVLPWVEVGLGIFLLLGLYPRIVAALCLPLAAGFIANNTWALINGVEEFPTCARCFGIWEEFLGTLSPMGAIVIDILLFCLALIILLVHKEGFFTFKPWPIRRKKMRD